MRRALVLASALAAAAIAGGVLYAPRSPQRSSTEAPEQAMEPMLREAPPAGIALAASDQAPNEPRAPQDEARVNSAGDDRSRRRPLPDEQTMRATMRKAATQDIESSYSMLLEDLDLPQAENDDLVEVLIDMLIESMWSHSSAGQIRGRTIEPQERHDRIAAVIGDEKLQEFLTLEENVGAYWETGQIARLLRRHGAPLSANQREGVFDILVAVNERYPITEPTGVDRYSVEYVEHTMQQIDEIDRHIVELAPSVLSSTQVVHLHDAYQAMAYGRVTSLERQKKMRVERPDAPVGWSYPARWQDLVIR